MNMILARDCLKVAAFIASIRHARTPGSKL